MTIKEFALLAGVSVSTVSKIMNGKDASISARTREHVLKLAKEYNYVPYASAAAPTTRTLTMGVIFQNTEHGKRLVSSILKEAASLGYSLLLRESGDSVDTELKNISAMAAAHTDGVIWEPVSSDSLFLGEKLDRAGIPYVVIGPYKGAFHMDFEKIGDTATGLLVKKRHASIACVAGDDSLAREFFQGYRKRLFDEKLPFRQELVFPDAKSLPVSGILNGLFTAAVFFSQAEALKFYETARNLQYEIPEDLSLLTLRDGSSGGDLPFLSSLAVPFDAFGSQAARLLVARIEKWEHMPEFSPDFPLNTETTLSVPRDLQKKRVISIGSVNMDNYLAFDALPHSGRTVTSSDSATYPGGKCLNQAVGVARLGHHVSVIGRVGGDADSDSIYQAVRDCRIDSSGLLRTPGQKTGQAYIFVQKNGESMISILSGANSQVCPGDITAAERLFDGACCCLIQTEIPMEAVLTAASMAKRYGLMTVLKPSSCGPLPEELLKNIDVAVPNAEELSMICPGKGSIKEKAARLLSHGIKTVIVTLGAGGCWIFGKETACHIEAADFRSVDNTGAADAFISALVSYLLYGFSMEASCRIASCAAGFSITRQGGTPALVDKDTLEQYLEQNSPSLIKEADRKKDR